MSRSKWLPGLVPVILLVVAGCEKSSTTIHHDLDLSENSAKVVAAQNQFTFKLFKAAQKQDKAPSSQLPTN